MLNALDSFIICTKFKMKNFIEELKKEELGVSAFVATILLILIVVLLSALFWNKISEWFNTTWEKIMGSSNSIG
ncbi:MAG: hypothetical protein HDQ96_14695 [Lachnospiraceae bacterium]|nr:hypothetical protein [Lachnospiraceae bacterium]